MSNGSTAVAAERRLSISEAAAEVGLSAHTLRYYENIGLVPGVTRNGSGHRRYTSGQLRWLKFLDRLRHTGMPIARMREYAALASRGSATLPERYDLLQAHKVDLEEQMAEVSRCLAALEVKMGGFAPGHTTPEGTSPEDACLANDTCTA